MNAHLQKSILAVYQQSPLWTLTLPGDAASGLSSTAWTPVAAEIARHTGTGATDAAKKAVYGQVVAELTRTAEQAATPNRSPHFTPAERLAFGAFVQVLLHNYRPLLAA